LPYLSTDETFEDNPFNRQRLESNKYGKFGCHGRGSRLLGSCRKLSAYRQAVSNHNPGTAMSDEYLNFTEQSMRDGRKTKVWATHSKIGGSFLGWVAWFSAWRKYTFRPADATTFDHKWPP